MKMKKIIMITIFLFCLISLVSCGAPSNVKQEAKERLEKYKPIFEQKVEEVYGSDARLKNVKCDVTTYVGSPVPSVSYSANKYLSGTISLNGRNYDASYDTLKNRMTDNVHTEDICGSVIDALPLDTDKFFHNRKLLKLKIQSEGESVIDGRVHGEPALGTG